MPADFHCAIHLRGDVPVEDAAGRLAACLPVLRAHGLAPFDWVAATSQHARPDLLGGTRMAQSEFAKASGDPFWGAGFMCLRAAQADATLILMSVPATPVALHLEIWNWLTRCAEDLHDAIAADLGMINGFTIPEDDVDDEAATGGTPTGPDVAPGHPPRVLLPWMYFGPRRLAEDGLEDGLTALAQFAFRSSGTAGGGWVLQAHAEYSAASPDDLLAAYAHQFEVMPSWMAEP
jgi:hypothetical protein